MTKEEKIKAIEEIDKQYISLVERVIAISKLKPCKTFENAISRAAKCLSLTMEARNLNIQKLTILAIPTQKDGFKPKSGIAFIPERGDEIIVDKTNGTVKIFQYPEQRFCPPPDRWVKEMREKINSRTNTYL